MRHKLCCSWRSWSITLLVFAVSSGCGTKPPAEKPAANPPAAAAAARAPETPVESPAFDSPEEAVQAWARAYQQDGEAGHRRLTFDQNNLPDEQWQKTLAEGYTAVAEAGEVQILETLHKNEVAAVIVRLGERVDRITLFKDAKGWHVCRTLRNWDAVKMPSEYRGVMKTAYNLGTDATVSEIEWRKKLAPE